MRTAFFVDGGFFLKRFHRLEGSRPPSQAARALHQMCLQHLEDPRRPDQEPRSRLYRIFYYDCPPLTRKVHNPVTRRVDFASTPLATWRRQFLDELKRQRKVALRLGYLNDAMAHRMLRPDVLKDLLARRTSLDAVTESDVKYEVRQKGVDMRLGLDIASIAYKKQADQVVLVAGDSDFVPAAKLARREGIDFILDPKWAPIRPDLHEHIDGLRSVLPRPARGARADSAERTSP